MQSANYQVSLFYGVKWSKSFSSGCQNGLQGFRWTGFGIWKQSGRKKVAIHNGAAWKVGRYGAVYLPKLLLPSQFYHTVSSLFSHSPSSQLRRTLARKGELGFGSGVERKWPWPGASDWASLSSAGRWPQPIRSRVRDALSAALCCALLSPSPRYLLIERNEKGKKCWIWDRNLYRSTAFEFCCLNLGGCVVGIGMAHIGIWWSRLSWFV